VSLLLLLLCAWASLTRSSHLPLSEVFTLRSLRKEGKKRMNSAKFAGTEFSEDKMSRPTPYAVPYGL
jgi:hypothetical protein